MRAKSIVSLLALCLTLMAAVPVFAAPTDGGDTSLARNVRETLGGYYGSGISVYADNGRVYLSGQVGTDQDKKNAVALAQKTPGVTVVHENLEAISGSES